MFFFSLSYFIPSNWLFSDVGTYILVKLEQAWKEKNPFSFKLFAKVPLRKMNIAKDH
jgi:hypothetical protein